MSCDEATRQVLWNIVGGNNALLEALNRIEQRLIEIESAMIQQAGAVAGREDSQP